MDHLLGPKGEATIILFSAQFKSSLPKLKDLKRHLKIPDGQFYKSWGQFRYNIRSLIDFQAHKPTLNHPFTKVKSLSITDIFLTLPNVKAHAFIHTFYAEVYQGGFNLTEQALKDLENLMSEYRSARQMAEAPSSFRRILESNQRDASRDGSIDPTLLTPEIDAFEKLFSTYGHQHLNETAQKLKDWHDKYSWANQVVTFKPRASTDEAADDTETAGADSDEVAESTP